MTDIFLENLPFEKLEQLEFKGELRFLSNMYPCKISLKDIANLPFPNELKPEWMKSSLFCNEVFGSSEHIYQACKSDSVEWVSLIHGLEDPHKTKFKARKLIPKKHPQIVEFTQNKVQLMKWIVTEKFLQNPHLMKKLKATGNKELIERNYWGDVFWGQCGGVGENHLGKILMEVRESFC